jgi:hypothetical protein
MASKPWSPDEVKRVVASLLEKKSLEDISSEHGRSVNSIKYKTLEYACDEVLNGRDAAVIVKNLQISNDDFKREVSRRNPLPVITPKPKLASIVSSVPLIPKLRMEAKVPIPVVKVPIPLVVPSPVVSSVPLIPKLRMVSPIVQPLAQPLASPIVSPLVPKLPFVKKEKVNNIPDLNDILKDIDSLRSRLNKYITANESK